MVEPLVEAGVALQHRDGVLGELDGRVFRVGGFGDKDILLAVADVVMRSKSALLGENLLGDAQVLNIAAIGGMNLCQGEILHGVQQVVEMQQAVERGFLFLEGAVSQNNLTVVLEVAGHFLQPMGGCRGVFRVGEDKIGVRGATDTHREGKFLAADCGDGRVEFHQLEVAVLLLVLDHQQLRVVLGVVVHHHHLEITVLLVQELGKCLQQHTGGVLGHHHDGDRRLVQILLRFFLGEGESSVYQIIVQKLYESDGSKYNYDEARKRHFEHRLIGWFGFAKIVFCFK